MIIKMNLTMKNDYFLYIINTSYLDIETFIKLINWDYHLIN